MGAELLHFKVKILCNPVFVYDRFIIDIARMIYSLLSKIPKEYCKIQFTSFVCLFYFVDMYY